ncbi:MAG: hypothetical protein AB8H79_17895, partial [Myxococcota bacterium]
PFGGKPRGFLLEDPTQEADAGALGAGAEDIGRHRVLLVVRVRRESRPDARGPARQNSAQYEPTRCVFYKACPGVGP